jgi:hypothetical protein
LPILAIAFLVASCDGSPVGNTGDALRDNEIEDLLGALIETALAGSVDSLPDGTFRRAVDRTGSCGSDVAAGFYSVRGVLEGERDGAVNDFRVTGQVDVDYFRCALRAAGTDMEIEGDRSVRSAHTAERVGNTYTLELDLRGGFAFVTADDRSGRCAVDLRVSLVIGLGPEDVVAEGSICRRRGATITSL